MVRFDQLRDLQSWSDYFMTIWKVSLGIIYSLSFALLPLFSSILIMEAYMAISGKSHMDSDIILNTIPEILLGLSISLWVAFISVYVLRLLYWLRTTVQYKWNEVTPPYNEKDEEEQFRNKEPEVSKASSKTQQYLKIGTLVYFVPLTLLLLIAGAADVTGFSTGILNLNDLPNLPIEMKQLVKFISLLPLLGELSDFYDLLPGSGIPDTILLNAPAIPFAIALRNYQHIIENYENSKGKCEFLPPNQIGLYFWVFPAIIICFSFLIILFGW